jgi:hypothetical protein
MSTLTNSQRAIAPRMPWAVCILVALSSAVAAQAADRWNGRPRTVTFSSSNANFPNPDRGFYAWGGRDFVSGFDLASIQVGHAEGMRLALANVHLGAYRNTDLPDAFLATLAAHLADVRAAGMKVILLFAYDFSEQGQDATAAQITRHLQQLQPVLNAHADVIPFMRAGFIGAWGEWHSSKGGNSCGFHSGDTACTTARTNRTSVRDALLRYVPATTQLSFRYPSDLQSWYPKGDGPARVGAHNDCFLAGPTDTGTYTSATQRPYVHALTQRASFGGETCENAELPLRKACSDILSEGPSYHLAWLNSAYATSVLSAWKREGCYGQVAGSMGYRLQLDAVTHDATVAAGHVATVLVDLRNVGWARMFTARRLVLTLRQQTTGATITLGAGDLSALPAQATASSRIAIQVAMPQNAQAGAYDVLLSAPDVFASTAADPRFAVRFANADNPALAQAWDPATARWATGSTLQVEAP